MQFILCENIMLNILFLWTRFGRHAKKEVNSNIRIGLNAKGRGFDTYNKKDEKDIVHFF
jgi:hypothetical protein